MAEKRQGQPPIAGGERLPSLRGVVIIDTFRGRPRVRKWPRKRGPPKSLKHKNTIAWFVWANRMAKASPARTQIAAMNRSRRTGFYPRDLMVAALRGTLVRVSLSDGRRYTPLSNARTVSDNLDLVGAQPGDTLRRDSDRWIAVPAGQGASAGYDWIVPTGVFPNTNNTLAAATKGCCLVSRFEFDISGLAFAWSQVSGATYKASVAIYDPATSIISSIASSAPVVSPSTVQATMYFPVAMHIPASVNFAVLITRTDTAGNVSISQHAGGHFTMWPVAEVGRCRIATNAPAVGQTLIIDAWGTNWPYVAARWS